MKIVSDKLTGEIIKVDEAKVPDWKDRYNHRNWSPFEGAKPVEQLSTKELEDIATVTMTIEEAREAYLKANNKPVSNRYKNNMEWILSRI